MRLLILFLLLPFLCDATTYYVAKTGNDGNSGTNPASPLKTCAGVNAKVLQPDDWVLFNRGDTFYGRLNCTESGTLGHPIHYNAYGTGALPVITGLTQATNWVGIGNGVYAAPMPGIKSYCKTFLLNWGIQAIGRYPNSGYLNFNSATNSPSTITVPSFNGTPNYTGYGVQVRSSHFIFDSATITLQSGSVLTLSRNMTYLNAGGTGMFLQGGNRLLLDSMGEAMPNPTLDSVWMFFGAADPNNFNVMVSTVDTLCLITTSDNEIKNIAFEGGTMYNLFEPFGNGRTLVDNVTFRYGLNGFYALANNISVTNCIFDSLTNNGLWSPTNNVGQRMICKNNVFHYIGMTPGLGTAGNLGNYHAIKNPSDYGLYQYNSIQDIGYIGIMFSGDSTCVLDNYIVRVCQILDDGGAIYTWDGSVINWLYERIIKRNYCEGGGLAPSGSAFDIGASVSGIYSDSYSKRVLIDSNTARGFNSNGIFVHGSDIRILRNNSFDNGYAQIYISQQNGTPQSGVVAKYNVVGSSDNTIALIRYNTPLNDIATFAVADSNYYLTSAGGTGTQFWTRFPGDNGTFRTLSGWRTITTHDAISTFQTGTFITVSNTGNRSIKYYLPGIYQDAQGATYKQIIPLNPRASAQLLQIDDGTIILHGAGPIQN